MKQTIKQKWITWAALFLVLPTAYFIIINILKEVFGINGPYNDINPFLESMGIRGSLGWNINLIILFGPVAAGLLTIFQVLSINWVFSREQFEFHVAVRKRRFPLLVAAFSTGLLVILFLYLLGENCNCQNF